MLAFSRPEPRATRTRPTEKMPDTGTARVRWPSMMIMPARATVLRGPSTRSANQPPGRASRYERHIHRCDGDRGRGAEVETVVRHQVQREQGLHAVVGETLPHL